MAFLLPRRFQTMWAWRGFIIASSVREIRSRYARSLFGWAWLLLPPAAMIAIYSFVFSKLMRSAGLPDQGPYTYTIYLCSGLLTWQWFSELLLRVVGLFSQHGPMMKRTLVPWPSFLLVDLLVTGFGLAVQLGLFALFLLLIGAWPGWRVLELVPLVAVQALLAVGLGLGLSVLQVFFRDVGLALPVFLQVWFWATPVVYLVAALPDSVRGLLYLNPVLPLVQGYQRIALFPQQAIDWPAVAWTAAVAIALLLASINLLRRNRSLLSDEL